MSEAQSRETLERCSEHQIKAMEAIFAFDEAMQGGDLSTDDLAEVFGAAIAGGHEMIIIGLCMAIHALEQLDH